MEKLSFKRTIIKMQPRNMDNCIYCWSLGYVDKQRLKFLIQKGLVKRIESDFAFVKNKDYSLSAIFKYVSGDVDKLRKDIETKEAVTDTFKNF